MVQIRREHLIQRSSPFVRSILGCIRFLLLSAVIPGLFVLRHYWFTTHTGSLVIVPLPALLDLTSAQEKQDAFVATTPEKNLRSPGSPPGTAASTTEQSQQPQPPSIPLYLLTFLQSIIPTTTRDATVDTNASNVNNVDDSSLRLNIQIDSDLVELDHCNIAGILQNKDSLSNFTAWSYPLLNATVQALLKEHASLFGADADADARVNTDVETDTDTDAVGADGNSETESSTESTTTPQLSPLTLMQAVEQEFLLELLELYATASGLCDFARYQPTVPSDSVGLDVATTKLNDAADIESMQQQQQNIGLARLAVSIVAYQDAAHLQQLIQAIHLPQHVIVVHLDRRTNAEFRIQVQEICDHYDNVVVLEFGTIAYKTDSVSMVNLRMMRWLVYDLELQFDFFLTLGGAAYPLQGAHDLAYSLQQGKQTGRRVWLGELTHKGERVKSPQDSRLRRKRLVFTRGGGNRQFANANDVPLFSKRLPTAAFSGESLPDAIVESMTQKSVSGNQAIFAYETVKELLDSSSVMELFARSKYGCCCCLEERNWIAALTMIGLQEEALQQASMWQVWGGAETCQSSMRNALLSRNASLCFRLEDATLDPPQMYIRGDVVMDFLKDAKQRGFYFARKFHSDHAGSMELLEDIWLELHGNDIA